MTTKWKLLALAAGFSGLLTPAAEASCSQIVDHDKRQMCRAEERQQASSCASIKNEDDRQLCRARTR